MTLWRKRKPFLTIITKFFRSPKIAFSKGVNPCFGQKMPIFFVYVDLQRIRLKIMLSDFVQENFKVQNPKLWVKIMGYGLFRQNYGFQSPKVQIFQSPKICIYPKGLTQDFDQKMSISSLFRFGQRLERSRNNA